MAWTSAHALSSEQALEQLGETTYDIYLNEVAYWRNIPARVWGYYIGGYQVIKKWLSYRERPPPGPIPDPRRGSGSHQHGPAPGCHLFNGTADGVAASGPAGFFL